MPHDWVNAHVFDGDDEHDRTIVKQCARCRMLAIVGETAAASAVDYYPQHVRAPQDCARGDMTEERALILAAVTEQRDLWMRQCNLTSEREADLRNRVAELEAERDRMRPVVDAAVRWETSYGAGRHAVLTDAVRAYLAATPKEGE